MPTRARERLVETAGELFYAEGVRAVGVERLLAVSGVGRASFYRHFAGKDELVVAVLRAQGEEWRAWLRTAVEDRGGGPLAIFDALAERLAADDFRGCAAINAMVETADPGAAAHRVAAEHKRDVAAYVAGLLRAAGHPDPAALAEQFMILIDGAIVTALRERGPAPAVRAGRIAARLLGE
ncbi:TetR/AcrR family transcriptional regulator [Actinomadura sediminis]|uniref:TetR/AcrR family transcriptional regulator n=1 Tax=Actinomadura sediminis TaxID=1038904 RepID=A0ABW3EZF9_9ACTN